MLHTEPAFLFFEDFILKVFFFNYLFICAWGCVNEGQRCWTPLEQPDMDAGHRTPVLALARIMAVLLTARSAVLNLGVVTPLGS